MVSTGSTREKAPATTLLLPASHLLLLLRPSVEHHHPSSQPGLHPPQRDHILGPVVRSLRVHRPQLLVALSDAVQTPQLVAQAFTLLSQDVDLFERRITGGTRSAVVHGGVEPGQSGFGAGVRFAHASLVHTEQNTWDKTEKTWQWCDDSLAYMHGVTQRLHLSMVLICFVL